MLHFFRCFESVTFGTLTISNGQNPSIFFNRMGQMGHSYEYFPVSHFELLNATFEMPTNANNSGFVCLISIKNKPYFSMK